MNTTHNKARTLHSLHKKGTPLVLYNIWDAGSAMVAAKSGAKVIATGSWSVASSFGYEDGENLPLDLVLSNLKRITEVVDLPVTIDIEAGYGKTPEGVSQSVTQVIKSGAVGFNLEDQIIGGDRGLYTAQDQSNRIAAARSAADALDIPAFINARTDVFLRAGEDDDKAVLLEEVLERGKAYQSAGCDGLFVPGLIDVDLIRTLCEKCQLPINVMTMQGSPTKDELAVLGVSRISHGPGPYQAVMYLIANECGKIYT